MKIFIGRVIITIGMFLRRIGGQEHTIENVGQIEIYRSLGKLNSIVRLGCYICRVGYKMMALATEDELFEDMYI